MSQVRKRRRGRTRISGKNKVTIPVEELRQAGLRTGDEVRVEVDGAGRIALVREDDVLAHYAGDLTGVYPPGYLERLRDEWR
jgi:bifunctional DNA-binding transcriptional regulator/antitoxin component of YhaV-PrlF toxin-antitoxin module